MLRFRSVAVMSVCLGLLAGAAASQEKSETDKKGVDTAGDASPAAAIPNMTIEVDKREKIVGIPPGMPTLAPTLPLEDGGMLVRYVNLPAGAPDPSHPFSLEPVLVRVKSAQETNRFEDSYPGLSGVTTDGKIAVSKDQVVLLVRAITNDEKLNAPDTPPHSFLAYFELNGRLKKTVPVDVGRGVFAMGAFGNGEILIADDTRAGGNSMRKHLRVYNDKGEFQKELFQDDPNVDLKKADRSSSASGEIIELLPYGDNVLAVYRSGDGLLLDDLNPAGLVREWHLVLPQGDAAFQLVPSNGPYWLVSYEEDGQGSGHSHRVDGIFEFNKATSEIVANLTAPTPGILMGAVYQRDGVIVGLLNDPRDFSPQFAEASIGGK